MKTLNPSINVKVQSTLSDIDRRWFYQIAGYFLIGLIFVSSGSLYAATVTSVATSKDNLYQKKLMITHDTSETKLSTSKIKLELL